jgi:hypothetical protein
MAGRLVAFGLGAHAMDVAVVAIQHGPELQAACSAMQKLLHWQAVLDLLNMFCLLHGCNMMPFWHPQLVMIMMLQSV